MFPYPKIFWGQNIINDQLSSKSSPTKVVPNNITFCEIWYGHKPIFSHLPIFGCKAYALIRTRCMLEIEFSYN